MWFINTEICDVLWQIRCNVSLCAATFPVTINFIGTLIHENEKTLTQHFKLKGRSYMVPMMLARKESSESFLFISNEYTDKQYADGQYNTYFPWSLKFILNF